MQRHLVFMAIVKKSHCESISVKVSKLRLEAGLARAAGWEKCTFKAQCRSLSRQKVLSVVAQEFLSLTLLRVTSYDVHYCMYRVCKALSPSWTQEQCPTFGPHALQCVDEVLMIELQQRRDNLKLWWHHESANSDFLVLWNRLSQRAGWPHCKRCRSHTCLTHRYFLYIKVCYREKQCYDTHTFTFFTCLEWLISYRWKVNDFHSGLIVCLASFHMNDLRNLTCLPLSYRMII